MKHQTINITDIPGEVQHIIESFYDDSLSPLALFNDSFLKNWNNKILEPYYDEPINGYRLTSMKTGISYPANVHISCRNLEFFEHVSPKCSALSLSFIDDLNISFITNLKNLKCIDFNNSIIPSYVISYIKQLPKLEEIKNLHIDESDSFADITMTVKKLSCHVGTVKYFRDVESLIIEAHPADCQEIQPENVFPNMKCKKLTIGSWIVTDFASVKKLMAAHMDYLELSMGVNMDDGDKIPNVKKLECTEDHIPFITQVKSLIICGRTSKFHYLTNLDIDIQINTRYIDMDTIKNIDKAVKRKVIIYVERVDELGPGFDDFHIGNVLCKSC